MTRGCLDTEPCAPIHSDFSPAASSSQRRRRETVTGRRDDKLIRCVGHMEKELLQLEPRVHGCTI